MQMYKSLLRSLISLLVGIYSEVDLLDHMVILSLTCWKTPVLFVPFYILTYGVQGFQFLHIPANPYFLFFMSVRLALWFGFAIP